MPKLNGILETSLYVADVDRSARFYESLFGFARMFTDNRLCAMSILGNQVLLLFLRGASVEPVPLAGGVLPPHDGSGTTHLAFACTAGELQQWEKRLSELEVPVESRVAWERGGHSIYFRDPDENLIELATPGIWPIY
ncbi:MAG TPA: VOC family protein [Pirellulales bacterium]|jgi:catechol 2,3-dioxygenase-like lactoylglutathione lyase family enzyme